VPQCGKSSETPQDRDEPVDDGGCPRRFDSADARMGSVHRPPMSTLDLKPTLAKGSFAEPLLSAALLDKALISRGGQ
jgi:hypothetical protein